MNSLTSPFPEKMYVELTTRCNLRCAMCLKVAEGSCIEERDLELEIFRRLLPALAHVRFLVLNGLGEPFLHPHLETIVALARKAMPVSAVLGFQTNGLLLNAQRAESLLHAGLDTICLSVDSLETNGNGDHESGKGHPLIPVTLALAHLAAAQSKVGRSLSTGIEVVLCKETLPQLPDMVRWAFAHGVDYLIVSHLFSYDGTMEDASLFNPNSLKATRLFEQGQAEAVALGRHLGEMTATQLRFVKSTSDLDLLQIGAKMQKEARAEDITLHLPNLLKYSTLDTTAIQACFDQAEQAAAELGIELLLPPLHAPANGLRSCPFIEEKAIFIGSNGDIMPCHFLWHTYSCMVNREQIQVQAKRFGNLGEHTLEDVWHLPQYVRFRAEAAAGEYAPCWSCSSGPCPDLVGSNILGMSDCYGTHVPCGHCMWSIGWIKCL